MIPFLAHELLGQLSLWWQIVSCNAPHYNSIPLGYSDCASNHLIIMALVASAGCTWLPAACGICDWRGS